LVKYKEVEKFILPSKQAAEAAQIEPYKAVKHLNTILADLAEKANALRNFKLSMAKQWRR
jgi:hypothetical protein